MKSPVSSHQVYIHTGKRYGATKRPTIDYIIQVNAQYNKIVVVIICVQIQTNTCGLISRQDSQTKQNELFK